MDPLSHGLCGVMVGRLMAAPAATNTDMPDSAPRPSVRQIVCFGIAATEFPDIDIVLRAVSELTYLVGHRGVTHSLILLPLWALLLTRLWARGAQLLGRPIPGGWRALYATACIGLVVHILGDLITQYGTMIFAPFSWERYAWGTTFVVDLGILALLTTGALCCLRWCTRRLPAVLTVCAVLSWIGMEAWAKQQAQDSAREWAQQQGMDKADVAALAGPLSPFNWTLLVAENGRYHLAHVNLMRTHPTSTASDAGFLLRLWAGWQPLPHAQWHTIPRWGSTTEQQTLAHEAWNRPEFAFYRWFARFPALVTIQPAPDGSGQCIGFDDLRYALPVPMPVFRMGLCESPNGWRLFREHRDGSVRWMQ